LYVKSPKTTAVVVFIIMIVLWLLSGLYTVKSGEEAVVLRFGKHVKTVYKAGLSWHLPNPIEKVVLVNISEVRRLEFGFRTTKEGSSTQAANYVSIPEQSLMITGDENLVNVEVAIQYRITDTVKYLFNVDDPILTLTLASESSIRRAIANNSLDEVLTENKFSIQQEIRDDLQSICDKYSLGIGITAVQLQDVYPPTQVDNAFKDVSNAREDRTSFINKAESYQNEIIPKARGNAAEALNKAFAYKERRISEANGDVANFVQILERYALGKEVTRSRMYLETMEEILPGIEKYIVNGDGNTIQWLPLEQSSILKNDKD